MSDSTPGIGTFTEWLGRNPVGKPKASRVHRMEGGPPEKAPEKAKPPRADGFISWTTPHMRADKALRAVAEHMEFKRFPEARAALAEALKMQRELMRCIDKAEAEAAKVNRNQVPDSPAGSGQ
jgi:hypothetical protein